MYITLIFSFPFSKVSKASVDVNLEQSRKLTFITIRNGLKTYIFNTQPISNIGGIRESCG